MRYGPEYEIVEKSMIDQPVCMELWLFCGELGVP